MAAAKLGTPAPTGRCFLDIRDAEQTMANRDAWPSAPPPGAVANCICYEWPSTQSGVHVHCVPGATYVGGLGPPRPGHGAARKQCPSRHGPDAALCRGVLRTSHYRSSLEPARLATAPLAFAQ